MPLAPKKKFARFNVGHFMKERKQAQEELASTNHLIEGERKKLEAAQLQLRRLQNKVWHRNGFRLFYICSFLFSFVT